MSHKTRVLITVAVLVLGIVGVAGTAVATHEDDHVAEIKDIQINGVDEDGDGYYRSFDIEINADTICNGCYDEGWLPGADSYMEPYFTVEINNVEIESTSDVTRDSDLTYTISVPESEMENFQTELDATLEVHLMERDAVVDDHIDGVTRDIRIEHAEDDEANQPPVASLTVSPSSPSMSDTVTFDASGSSDPDGNIQSYEWDFGDGNTATGQTPTHSYSSSGDYTVELTVTDDSGATDTTTRTVSVTGEPPTASFTYSPDKPDAGESVSFDASGSSDPDGTVQRYEWDFGDGNTATATGDTVSHTYSNPGTYTIELTVEDNEGATNTTTQTVEVEGVEDDGTAEITQVGSVDPDGQLEIDYEYEAEGSTSADTELKIDPGNNFEVNITGIQGDGTDFSNPNRDEADSRTSSDGTATVVTFGSDGSATVTVDVIGGADGDQGQIDLNLTNGNAQDQETFTLGVDKPEGTLEAIRRAGDNPNAIERRSLQDAIFQFVAGDGTFNGVELTREGLQEAVFEFVTGG